MFTMPEQFVDAAKLQIDSHLTMLNALTKKTFSHVEKIISLNIAASKVSVLESNATLQKLLSTKSPQEFFSVTIAQVKPSIEKFHSYSLSLIEVTKEMATEPLQEIEKVIVSLATATPVTSQLSAPVAEKQDGIHLAALAATEPRPVAQPIFVTPPHIDEAIKPQAAVKSAIEAPTATPTVEARVATVAGNKPIAAQANINPAVNPSVKADKPITENIATKSAVKATQVKPALASQAWQAPKIKRPSKK